MLDVCRQKKQSTFAALIFYGTCNNDEKKANNA
jgi:hypothetical protein